MLRTLLGTIVGVGVAGCTLWAARHAYLSLHPALRIDEATTAETLAAHAAAAPGEAVASLLAGCALAAFVGAWTGALIARHNRGAAALTVGALVMATVIVQATREPGPEWMTVLALLLPMPFAVMAKLLATPRREF